MKFNINSTTALLTCKNPFEQNESGQSEDVLSPLAQGDGLWNSN